MSPKSSTPFIWTTARDSGWEPENIVLLSIAAYTELLPQTSGSLPASSNPKLSCGRLSCSLRTSTWESLGEEKEGKNKNKNKNKPQNPTNQKKPPPPPKKQQTNYQKPHKTKQHNEKLLDLLTGIT